jgi:hypothetical protein
MALGLAYQANGSGRHRRHESSVRTRAAVQLDTEGRKDHGDQGHWKRGPALYLLRLASLMIVLDMTTVNMALPSIKAHLGFSDTSVAWVVDGYLLAYGGFLLLGGRLGDLFRSPPAPSQRTMWFGLLRAVLLHNDVTTR